jgi:hypothetical protein
VIEIALANGDILQLGDGQLVQLAIVSISLRVVGAECRADAIASYCNENEAVYIQNNRGLERVSSVRRVEG